MMSRTVGLLACALAVLLLAGAMVSGAVAASRLPTASAAWVLMPAVAGRPAAGYFTLTGGAAADRLIGATSPRASKVELHGSMAMGGMATGGMAMGGMTHMAALASVPLLAGGTVAFAPGGNHLMLFDVKPGAAPIPLTLRFASGATVNVAATPRAAGEGAP